MGRLTWVGVSGIYPHSRFNFSSNHTIRGDLCVLRLSAEVDLKTGVARAVKLSSKRVVLGQRGVVCGFGYNGMDEIGYGDEEVSGILYKLTTTVIDSDKCKQYYADNPEVTMNLDQSSSFCTQSTHQSTCYVC